MGDQVTMGAVGSREVRLKEGRSLPRGASRRSSALVCRIESRPHRAAPLTKSPSRIPWYSRLSRVGKAVAGIRAIAAMYCGGIKREGQL